MTNIVAGVPIINSTQVLVDDRNPLVSYYGGPWSLGGFCGNEYECTTHGTSSPASVHLSFQGTSIAVYGSVGGGSPSCQESYMLDGVVIRQLEQPTVNLISSSIPLFGVQFFVSPALSAGTHTLNITLGPCGSADEVYWLDYFVFQPIV